VAAQGDASFSETVAQESYRLLDSINSVEDFKKLPRERLGELAEEIRHCLIQTLSRTGGHLAPNLGVVELTIALHRIFDSPRDKIIWDVGHQAYVHKILTGRGHRFHTIRQQGGLSGFSKRSESEHDPWGAGHGSTSISAALGMAKARDLKGGHEHVIAIVGDGAMTGGVALEGLNNAGHSDTNLIVILNDNSFSISPNVGAIAAYLSRVRMTPSYQRLKQTVDSFLVRLPAGEGMREALQRFKLGLKQLVIPGMLFEELGFTYIGPLDGHNIDELLHTFEQAKSIKGPVLVHVLTVKGKGYEPAEKDAARFHGTPPYKVESGEPLGEPLAGQAGEPAPSSGTTYSEAFGQTLVSLAEQDRRIVAITAAMCDGTGLSEFARRFPDRFFDVGMAEQHAVLLAGSMAAAGMRPVAAIYSTFLQRAYDQIIHDICLQRLPVVFAIDRAGLVGDDGPTHHGAFDISYLRLVPNIIIMAPRDLDQLCAMLRLALSLEDPVAIRYPRGSGAQAVGRAAPIEVGKGELLREGDDVAFLALGSMVEPCLAAAQLLQQRGISASVADARFVKPLDEELVLSLAGSARALLTVEENVLAGGFGSAVLELLARRQSGGLARQTWAGAEREAGAHAQAPVRCLGLPDRYIEHGSRNALMKEVGLDANSIAAAAEELLAGYREPAAKQDARRGG
jgi:1-deoxy-D-xylulose-5-phosphate synthase